MKFRTNFSLSSNNDDSDDIDDAGDDSSDHIDDVLEYLVTLLSKVFVSLDMKIEDPRTNLPVRIFFRSNFSKNAQMSQGQFF